MYLSPPPGSAALKRLFRLKCSADHRTRPENMETNPFLNIISGPWATELSFRRYKMNGSPLTVVACQQLLLKNKMNRNDAEIRIIECDD